VTSTSNRSVRAQRPRRIQLDLAHQPVDRRGDHRLVVHDRLPAEPAGRHRAGFHRHHQFVGAADGDGDLLGGPDARLGAEAELVGDHPHRLLEAAFRRAAIGPLIACSGVRPKPITSRTTSGAL
jgi:hypothetical protein